MNPHPYSHTMYQDWYVEITNHSIRRLCNIYRSTNKSNRKAFIGSLGGYMASNGYWCKEISPENLLITERRLENILGIHIPIRERIKNLKI